MKKTLVKQMSFLFSPQILLLLAFSVLVCGCRDDENANPGPSYEQVRLVADASSLGASKVDTNLVNAWGMAIDPTGAFWISSAEKDRTIIYDRIGTSVLVPIRIEGEPTGVTFNSTSDFIIPGTTKVSKFIYAGEDGTVQAWNTGMSSIEVAVSLYEGAV